MRFYSDLNGNSDLLDASEVVESEKCGTWEEKMYERRGCTDRRERVARL